MLRQRAQRPFVGRERELAALGAYLDAARQGEGGVVLVAGEPGIGKTRLVAELAEQARTAGWRVLAGAAYDAEGMPPYLPFVEALQSYVRTCPIEELQERLGAGAPEVALLLPEVRHRLPDLPTSPPLAAHGERYRLFESVADLLLNIAHAPAATGLLLCLDDLHWAEEATLLLLEHIDRRASGAPLLIVATYRDTELGAGRPLARTLERLVRRGPEGVVCVELGRFPEVNTAALIAALAGHEPPAQLVQMIQAETEGNPFFVHELFRYLADAGRLFDERGDWRTSVQLGEVDVPQSVRLVLDRRLDHVSEACRRALTSAAGIGRTFSCDLLSAVAGMDEDDLLEAINEAERSHLVESPSDDRAGRVCFAHELIRQTLLAGLSLPHRQRLHLRVADALERLHAADLTPHAAELANHYLLAGTAGDPTKAAAYARQAGEAAETVFAFAQAVAHYEAALRTMELSAEPDPLQRAELLLALGLAQQKTEMWRGTDTLVLAAGAARAAGRPDLVVRAVLGTAHLAPRFDERLAPLLRGLLDEIGAEESPPRAKLLAYLAFQLSAGPPEQRDPLFEEATAIARRVRDAEALAFVLQARHNALTQFGPPTPEVWESTIRLSVEQAELADETGNLSLAVSSHCDILQNSLWLGCIAPAEIDALIETHARLGAVLRQGTQIYHAQALRAMKALLDGRLDEVEPLAREANATIQGFGPSAMGTAVLSSQLLLLRREQGRLAEYAHAYRDWAAEDSPNPRKRAFLALLAAELGETDEAHRQLDELGMDKFAGIPHDVQMLATAALLAEACAIVGDAGHGQTLYALLLPRATMNVFPDGSWFYLGSVSRFLGLLAALLARAGVPGPSWDDAVCHFEHALTVHERIGARPMLARTAREYGETLLARGRRGDATRARDLLARAVTIYQELGMIVFVERTRALLHKMPSGPPPSPVPVYPDNLTAREVELLRLLAAGKSNREIGAALYISLNTVERHINHIFQKIGAQNRVEAARYAHHHGFAT